MPGNDDVPGEEPCSFLEGAASLAALRSAHSPVQATRRLEAFVVANPTSHKHVFVLFATFVTPAAPQAACFSLRDRV